MSSTALDALDARNLDDRPALDPTLRPPPSTDLTAVVNSGEVSILSNFVFWIRKLNVRMNYFDSKVRRKFIWFEC
jgi:hypothetical protein